MGVDGRRRASVWRRAAAGGGELRAEDEGEVEAHCAAFYSAENFSIVAKSVSLAAPSWIRPQARLYAQNFLSKRLIRAVDHFFVHSEAILSRFERGIDTKGRCCFEVTVNIQRFLSKLRLIFKIGAQCS